MPSAVSRGQNHTSRATHAAHTTTEAATLGRVADASGDNAVRKQTWASRNAPNPSTKDGVHHGIASRTSPAAENTSAATSQRRSRGTGWHSAAPASRTAVSALTAGWSTNWPVSSAPAGSRAAVTARKSPYATATTAAAPHDARVRRDAYGEAVPP